MNFSEDIKTALEMEKKTLEQSIKNSEAYIREFLDTLQHQKERLSAIHISLEALECGN